MTEKNSASPCVCLRSFLLWGLILTIVFSTFCSVRVEAAMQSDQSANEIDTRHLDDVQPDNGVTSPSPIGIQQGNGAMPLPPGAMQQGNGAMPPPPGAIQQGNGAMPPFDGVQPPGPPPDNFSSSLKIGPSPITAGKAVILALNVVVLCGGLVFSQCYHRRRKRF